MSYLFFWFQGVDDSCKGTNRLIRICCAQSTLYPRSHTFTDTTTVRVPPFNTLLSNLKRLITNNLVTFIDDSPSLRSLSSSYFFYAPLSLEFGPFLQVTCCGGRVDPVAKTTGGESTVWNVTGAPADFRVGNFFIFSFLLYLMTC